MEWRLAVMATGMLLALMTAVAGSRVTLVDNGYTGVVIGIDERVDVLQCQQIIENLQTLIGNASSYLYTATNQRAYFHDVTVVVPSSWPRSCTGDSVPDQATTQSYLTSDVRVSGPHPVYGSAPWTRQAGLCGRPGDFVQFAADYVASGDTETYGDQARVLVHEWAKYRWGVFEEAGYAEDPLYPSFYRSTADQWTPTGCADGTVAGIVSPPDCDESSNTCTFVPFLNETNDAVASSVMYLQALPQVKHFCDDSNHVTSAPTKHNLLCGEKSVWEVMEAHEDFRNGNNQPNANSTPPAVDFRIVKATTDRFFFLLESTATMRQQDRWDFVSNSIRKFINWDAPTGIQVGIGHFGSSYRTDRNLTTVPSSLMGRGELANLPPIADNVDEANKNWRFALDGALQSLGRAAAGATIIWVTGNGDGSDVQPAEDDIQFMISKLQERQARLVVVFYPSVTPGLARVAMASGGDVISMPDVLLGARTSITVFHALTDAYVYTLDKYISNKLLVRVQVEDEQFAGGAATSGTFLIDNTLGINTTFTVLFSLRSDIGYVRLRPPGGQMQEVYTYPDSTNHLMYTPLAQTQGQWAYEVDNLAPSGSSIFVQVTSTPASSEDTVRAEVWTSADDTGIVNATAAPLIVYASVMRGSAPVLDAEVYGVITGPGNETTRIPLLDNGLGVPDILHGDGIYSRYFTEFGALSEEGQLFTVRVEVGGTRARVVTGRALVPPRAVPIDGSVPCCGSSIGNVTSVPVADLSRAASGGGVLVTGGGGDPQSDVYPPNRVTDLTAETSAEEQTIAFSWSAPGDDYDKPDSAVALYEVRYSESRDRLRDHFSECQTVSEWSQPEPAGTPSLAVIDFHTVNTMFYFAIRGVDEAGNAAELSNIVALVMPPPPPTPTPVTPTGTSAPPQPTSPTYDNTMLLIILLCIAGVMLIIVLLALYYFLCHRRRKPDPGADASGSPRHITTVTVPPVESREPTPVKIAYDLDKEKGVQTISDGQTPSMWTASDILDTGREQHRRHSPDTDTYNNYGNSLTLSAAQLQNGAAAGRARYNSYQTPYVEDMAYDGRSLVSTQPSDSYLSLASDPRHRNNNTLSEGGEPAGWPSDKDSLVTSQQQRGGRPRAPPPTLPKPRLSPVDGGMSSTRGSVAGDRRLRNVTQV